MKKTISLLLISCILLSLIGCNNDTSITEPDITISTESTLKADSPILPDNENTEKTVDIPTEPIGEEELIPAFSFILNNLYDSLQINLAIEVINCVHFSTGIIETLMSCETTEERMKALAYCIKDINEDGIDELLILNANDPEPGNVSILDMYTVVEGTPVKVIEGWARNSYYLLNDGMIYCSSSGGAAYSNEELLSFKANSHTLTSKELYFTYPKNEDMSTRAYYYSPDGVYDVAAATEISADDYLAFYNECESKIVSFEAKTFDLFKQEN